MAANATTSPLATIKFGAASVAPQLEYVIDYVSNASTWTILATILATLVVYDQCMFAPDPTRPGLTTSADTNTP
jgi:C-22 sterol desaturase